MVDIDKLRESNPEASKVELLKNEASSALEINVRDVEDLVVGGPDVNPRFAYGFTTDGFFKITSRTDSKSTIKKLNRILRKESKKHSLVQDLSVPTTKLIDGYKESPAGLGTLLYERLDSDSGVILEGHEDIRQAPPEIGERVASNIDVVSGFRIPSSIDARRLQILRRLDKRESNPEDFWKYWNWLKSRILAKRYDSWRNNIIEKNKLKNIFEQAELLVNPYIERDEKSGNEYFMHNDMALSNTYIPEPLNSTDGPLVFMDFEHSGILKNRTLALISDLGNFYRRCWPNREMQERFIVTYLRNSQSSERNYTYALLKSAIVHSTMKLARWGMNVEGRRRDITVAILSNLEPNLDALDEEYSLLKSNN